MVSGVKHRDHGVACIATLLAVPVMLLVLAAPAWAGSVSLGADFPGALDSSFRNPQLNDRVRSVALQPDGKILVGGDFTTVGAGRGVPRNYLARLNGDGTLDTTFRNADVRGGQVHSIALQPDGKVLIGGDFTRVSGESQSSVARLNPDGSLDRTFQDPVVVGPRATANTVYSIALGTNGKVFIGGEFIRVGGQPRGRVARVDADGKVDLSFQDPGVDENVWSVAPQADGKVLVGGAFQNVAGERRSQIARLDLDGKLDPTFVAERQGGRIIYSVLALPDGKVLFGSALVGQGSGYVERLNSGGGDDNTFRSAGAFHGAVLALALQEDAKIVVGGAFNTIGDRPPTQVRQRVARLNADGTLDEGFRNPEINADVASIALQPNGRILTGGRFTRVGCEDRSYVAGLLGAAGTAQASRLATAAGGATQDCPDATVSVYGLKTIITARRLSLTSQVFANRGGKISQHATTGSARSRRTWCRTSKRVSGAGTNRLTCNLGSTGRRAMKRAPLKLTVKTTFTPTGGKAVSSTRKLTVR